MKLRHYQLQLCTKLEWAAVASRHAPQLKTEAVPNGLVPLELPPSPRFCFFALQLMINSLIVVQHSGFKTLFSSRIVTDVIFGSSPCRLVISSKFKVSSKSNVSLICFYKVRICNHFEFCSRKCVKK